jgi:hypothetical protein
MENTPCPTEALSLWCPVVRADRHPGLPRHRTSSARVSSDLMTVALTDGETGIVTICVTAGARYPKVPVPKRTIRDHVITASR